MIVVVVYSRAQQHANAEREQARGRELATGISRRRLHWRTVDGRIVARHIDDIRLRWLDDYRLIRCRLARELAF
jgi:hypothetical protein